MANERSRSAETAAAIRERLKQIFPEVNFSVRSKIYSGGDSITVHWTDGPVAELVDDIINDYQHGNFDGMTDSYNYSEIDSSLGCSGVDYTFSSRTLSPAREKELADFIRQKFNGKIPDRYIDEYTTTGIYVYLVEKDYPETWSQLNRDRYEVMERRREEADIARQQEGWQQLKEYEKSRGTAAEWAQENITGNPDYFKRFYAPNDRTQMEQYQAENPAYKTIFASDKEGENGDTWIVYRDVSDLPRSLQDYAMQQEAKQQPETSDERSGSGQEQIRYYPINESAAALANTMNSYSDYIPGSATAEYQKMVEEAAKMAEECKALHPENTEKIEARLDHYSRKLAAWFNRHYQIESYCPSWLVSGGSNFPTAKKEKQNDMRDKHMQEWEQVQSLLNGLRPNAQHIISADDPAARERLRKKLETLEAEQALMKRVNAHYRKYGTCVGCEGISPQKAQELDKAVQDYSWIHQPFSPYTLTNNNANIKRVQQRIHDLERMSQKEDQGWTFNGGTVKMNAEIMRVQVFFDDIPDVTVRNQMKQNGFKWAPSQKAWQRQLTDNGIRAAKRIPAIAPIETEEKQPSDVVDELPEDLEESRPIVGTITYVSSGEEVSYYTDEEYLKAISEAFNVMGINGWQYHTLSDSSKLNRQVTEVVRGEFGEKYVGDERRKEIETHLESETDDLESRKWREDLTLHEQEVIAEWEAQQQAPIAEDSGIDKPVKELRNTVVVNLFAGPSAGKTTCAWEIASKLKKKGYVVEYVGEYAKELVWDGRHDLLDGSLEHQKDLFAEQNRRVQRLIGQVDFVVTDSPILINLSYLKEPESAFTQKVVDTFKNQNNFNIFIERGQKFEQEGRIHNLEESKQIDGEIKSMLTEYGVYYGTYHHASVDVSISNMITTLKRTQQFPKKLPEQTPVKETTAIAEDHEEPKMPLTEEAIEEKYNKGLQQLQEQYNQGIQGLMEEAIAAYTDKIIEANAAGNTLLVGSYVQKIVALKQGIKSGKQPDRTKQKERSCTENKKDEIDL